MELNAGERALRDGWLARYGVSGEMARLQPRDVEIRCIINRDAEETPDAGHLEFRDSAQSEIEILREDVTVIGGDSETITPPNAGQFFEDKYGYRHEVQISKNRGWYFRCRCKVS